MKPTTTNVDILAAKKNYQIYCKKCRDFEITYTKKTLWYVERQLEMFNSLSTISSSPCDHDFDIREI